MTALQCCPFCGGEAELDTRRSYRQIVTGNLGSGVAVYCVSCDADMMRCREDVPDVAAEDLIAAWNRRAPATREQIGRAIASADGEDYMEDCMRFDRYASAVLRLLGAERADG